MELLFAGPVLETPFEVEPLEGLLVYLRNGLPGRVAAALEGSVGPFPNEQQHKKHSNEQFWNLAIQWFFGDVLFRLSFLLLVFLVEVGVGCPADPLLFCGRPEVFIWVGHIGLRTFALGFRLLLRVRVVDLFFGVVVQVLVGLRQFDECLVIVCRLLFRR